MSKVQKWSSFVILSMTGGIIFQVAYIRYVFLKDTADALNMSLQDYGNIASVFGVTAMVMYFFGGWFADRFSPKALISVALIGTGAADLYLSTVPGFTGVLIAHIVMAVMGMALYWSALVKAIGMLGSDREQGRLFGFLEGIRGVTSTVIGLAGAWLVTQMIVASEGVLTLIRVYGILCLVFAALVFFVVKERKDVLAKQESSAVSLGSLLAAAKNPYTWLIGGTVAAMFCFYTTLTYFTPLLQHEFGLPVVLIGVLGVVRSYVFQFVAGPVGGVVVDKVTRSTPRFLEWMFYGSALIAVVFLVLPRTESLMIPALILMFILCFFVFASRGVYWASVGELQIPENQRGGVIGLASGLAYLPDAFLPTLGAWWIGDPDQNIPQQGGGYAALFIFLIAVAALGVVLTRLTRARRARELSLTLAA
ncbi:MFS family permease [Mycetocola sp. BIGb0189]|uniref:MFS transporter n=1 Tax=Mycetocola sp. BIGb0189 TaxID=2940604 RepID=UPI002167015B|nr:MFS transporter [Mycetocola sp. BIGb0189]MCS4275044.1 MFS family permease [Mycetocola sp. BIGb0189]